MRTGLFCFPRLLRTSSLPGLMNIDAGALGTFLPDLDVE